VQILTKATPIDLSDAFEQLRMLYRRNLRDESLGFQEEAFFRGIPHLPLIFLMRQKKIILINIKPKTVLLDVIRSGDFSSG
jgi:hypothetical protein